MGIFDSEDGEVPRPLEGALELSGGRNEIDELEEPEASDLPENPKPPKLSEASEASEAPEQAKEHQCLNMSEGKKSPRHYALRQKFREIFWCCEFLAKVEKESTVFTRPYRLDTVAGLY